MLYAEGKGVKQDYVEVKELFGKACDLGDQGGCDGYRELNEQ
jgi:TPR repeat protein